MNQKNIIVILSIIIVLLLVVVGYLTFGNKTQPLAGLTPPPPTQPTTPPPPPVDPTSNWQIYKNLNYSFEFKYPPTYAFQSSGNSFLKEPIVSLTSTTTYPGTNFSGSSLGVSWDPSSKDCLTSQRDKTPLTEKQTINGLTFYKDSFTGATAGTLYTSNIYRTIRHNSCFEMVFTYALSNRGNYENPNSITEFNPAPELAIYSQILSTFKFTE